MKRILLLMIFSCFAAVGFAQSASEGDYRSVTTGDWTSPATWQVRIAGTWVAATVAPTSTSNVYLQTGHIINVDAPDVYCKDLHWGFAGSPAVYGSVRLNTSNLNVNGKVRVYNGHAAPMIALGTDAAFYSGQGSSTATNATQFTGSSTLGYLKFVGGTRDITVAGEWNGNGTVCYGIFALSPGATGTLNTGMKFRGLDIVSGNIVSNNGALAIGSTNGTGVLTIQNGAKLTSSRSSQVITQSSSAACETVDIQVGGILELTNNNPEINCNNFINNGTIIYSGANQNLAKTLISGANALTSYANLTINCSTGLNLAENSAITVSGNLNFTDGKLIIPANASLSLQNGNLAITGADANSYIQTLSSGASSGILKVVGLSTTNTFPVGTATHYTPVTLAPTAASSFDINVFEGATADATPNGTALTAAQKARMVDAVWNINRTAGTGNVDVTLGWDNTLEGADFASFTNAQIGISGYSGTAYNTFAGAGNAAANTATLSTSTLSPFIVGEANTTLPLTLISFTAKESLNSVKLDWRTTDEVNLKHYLLQHKVGDNFVAIQTVPANNKVGIFNYSYTHLNPLAGVNYYRLVGVDLDGTTHESEIKVVNVAVNKIAVYPNPVSQKNINVTGVVKGDVIKLFNIQGQIIATKTASGNQVLEIDVQNIQAGTYILSIENAGKITSTKKVIKI